MPAARHLARGLRAAMVRTPALPLAAIALTVLFVFALDEGGYFDTTWYAGAMVLLGLGVVGAVAVPIATRPPWLVLAAGGLLAAYAAWSYLSILWADQQADAWDAANLTLVYATVFALFAVLGLRGRPAAVLIGAFAGAIAVACLVELIRAAEASDPSGYFLEGRFAEPVGYSNGNVALWFTAFWPCVALAARREVPLLLRGAFAAGAVILGHATLLGQSRGWFFAVPVAALAFIALMPQRVRTTLTLLAVVGVGGAFAGPILDVYDKAESELAPVLNDAVGATVWAAAVAAAVVAVAALFDRASAPSPAAGRRAGLALIVAGVVAAIAGLLVFNARVGSPTAELSEAWREFKTKPTPRGGGQRFTGSLGSNRYDFWRVAWDRFEARPLAGIGADNFQQEYLRLRRSREAPRFPHSVELRVLSQTGLVGGALLGGAIAAALAAAVSARRWRRGLGAAAAGTAASVFAYWLLHGSGDWFWEMPALGGSAFALLGAAAGLAPRRPRRRLPLAASPAAVACVAALAGAAALSVALPWLSARYVKEATTVWGSEPGRAFDHLDRARSLNPLTARPDITAGAIALRINLLDEAERRFRAGIERNPGDVYAHLQLGMLRAADGERAEAVRLLRRASELSPRDDIVALVRRFVERGDRIDPSEINRRILSRSRQLGR